jgi:dephospho-CoA kinase
MALVLGIAGKIGSGKSTLSKIIAAELNYKYASFGDHVRKIALAKGISPTRRNLQNLGQQLLNENIKQFCLGVLSDIQWRQGQGLIIDGIRHEEIITVIKEIIFPDLFKLIFIKVDDDNIRMARMRIDDSDLKSIDDHPTENQVQSNKLIGLSDLTLDADKPISFQINQILSWYMRLDRPF